MIPTGLLLGHWALVYFILFPNPALAALQNVTVDDAVLTGAVVPQYLPSASSWNIGNNCSNCLVKPDPSQAYNGTWHDTTFSPGTAVSQTVDFTFTGSALFIFFIIANTVPNADTLTDVNFYLDEIAVGTFVHPPSTSTDYQYNVPVYVNESLTFGEHNMMIEPVDSGNPVLILFDYLIYTTDTDNATTSSSVSPSSSANSSSSPSQTPSGTQGRSSGQNAAAIVGGTVGGVAALVLLTVSLLCYRGYKRREGSQFPWEESGEAAFGPHGSLREVAPIAFEGTSTIHQTESPDSERESRSRRFASLVTLQPPSPAVSIIPPSTTSLLDRNNGLREQVELLREEVSRLQYLQKPQRDFR